MESPPSTNSTFIMPTSDTSKAPAATTEPLTRRGSQGSSRRRTTGWWIIAWTIFFTIAALWHHKPFQFDSLIGADEPRTAVILTAHPDDEAMFFAPTITSLISQGWGIKALCLSNGNGDGLGEERTKELYQAYPVLGVDGKNVTLMLDDKFQDGMDKMWNTTEIALALTWFVRENPASLIITFDSSGITQHPNHVALHSAVYAYTKFITPSPRALYLRSPSTYTKFTGPVVPWAYIYGRNFVNFWDSVKSRLGYGGAVEPKVVVVVGSVWDWMTGWKAMLQHKTQLVWFRWLYLAFSRLMWMNELEVC